MRPGLDASLLAQLTADHVIRPEPVMRSHENRLWRCLLSQQLHRLITLLGVDHVVNVDPALARPTDRAVLGEFRH